MTICEARSVDRPALRDLTASLGLDYDGMEADRFWIAREEDRVVGAVGLIRHSDGLELVSLGVDPAFRSRAVGRMLVEALMAATEGPIYLATVIPGFFRRCGFVTSDVIPAGMAKPPGWCDGCPRERCTVMVRVLR